MQVRLQRLDCVTVYHQAVFAVTACETGERLMRYLLCGSAMGNAVAFHVQYVGGTVREEDLSLSGSALVRC
jgi:hypothetical protein